MIGVNDDLDIKVICYIDLDYFILAELSVQQAEDVS
jgi:hypothetical protein